MKRLALSVICGFRAPFLYTVTAILLTPYITPGLRLLVGFPVKWLLFIYYRLSYLPFSILFPYIIVCNVLLYSLLSYFVLWALSKRKKAEYPFPPPPTDF